MLGIKSPGEFNPYTVNGGTIVAIAGEDYAVIGADTRLCAGDKWTVCSREQKKLFQISPRTVLGVSGCWCDVLTLTRLVRARADFYRQEHDKELSTPAAVQMLSTMLYYKRFFPFFVSSVIAGLDEHGKGCVYSFDPIGSTERSYHTASGSAETQLQPLLDSQINNRSNMQNCQANLLPKSKAIGLIKDAFISAAERDTCTGDGVYLMIVTADGLKEQKFPLRED